MRSLPKFMILTVCMLMILATGCHKSSDSGIGKPAQEYIEQLDQTIGLLNTIDSEESFRNAKEKINSIGKKYDFGKTKDYVLTPEDKKVIKEKTKELLTLTMEKTMQYDNLFGENEKDMVKQQIEILLQASDQYIDGVRTLGELTLPS